MRARGLRGGDDLFFRRIRLAVCDIFADGARKEEDILLDNADLVAQRMHGHVLNGDAVDRDGAFLDLVKAGQEVAQRRFAGPARTYKSDGLAGADRQADTVQYLLRFVVPEGNIIIDNVTLQA